ncbi:ATP-binding protein [Actinoallomurus sp. NPDC050550]|uniref:HAMP domain-containing sensor histidine kinase n=1 Tax=Actinoallomurus sp. NPDC050550 TaxID=3154937 RepID=UPI0033E2634A
MHRLWTALPRPLDPMRSIKIKLGVLAVCNCCVGGLMMVWGYGLGFRGRITLPVALLISVVITQILAHGMTAPLREMTAVARAMARGDYRRRVRVTSRDEVGELGRAFNRMADDLAEVDRQRRDFVANVSHELRTPIAALRAILENVADGVTPAEPEVLEGALAQVERLGRLVTQLLDLSRVEAGVVSLDLTSFEIGPFLEAAVTEAQVGRPGPVFVVRTEPGLVVRADRDRLHQVVANLLENAARHSPPGGVVTVTAATRGQALRLEVQDEGPGIPVADRAQVFERFSRGSASQVGTAGGGTGLGLAIARWVVDLHDGEIAVADSPHGCLIRVVLPQPPQGSS